MKKEMIPYKLAIIFTIVVSFVLAARADAVGQTTSPPPDEDEKVLQKKEESSENKFFKIDALAFGDLYGIASHHLEDTEGEMGGWLRRVYLTFDFNFSKSIFTRVRFEGNQDQDDFPDYGFSVDFKDVFLRWSIRRQNVVIGLSPTPTIAHIDRIWGYRHLVRTPLDLQGEPSRDTGIALQGPLNKRGRLRYRSMLGTGADFGKETGEGQTIMGAVTYGDEEGLILDIYGDHQRLPGETDRTSFQLFGHYRRGRARVGLQYWYQDRQEDPPLTLASAFGVVGLSPTVNLVGRVDRLIEPSPKGNDITFLPFDPTAKATLLIGAIEWRLARFFSVSPFVSVTRYDDPSEGDKPKDDFLNRIAFYIHT